MGTINLYEEIIETENIINELKKDNENNKNMINYYEYVLLLLQNTNKKINQLYDFD